MNSKKPNLIIFDGSNFYYKLKQLDIKNLVNFNFLSFIKSLKIRTNSFNATYYIGAIKTDGSIKSLELYKKQRQLLSNLRKQNIKYYLGYLLKSDGKFHEKGVNVQIAIDILIGAYENLYDTCYLVSSDTDIIPAIKKAQNLSKKITYIGFKHQPSHALLHNCNQSILLSKDDILKCA